MNLSQHQTQTEYQNCICPDIRDYWKLAQLKNSDRVSVAEQNRVILLSTQGIQRYQFSATEGYALRYFTGQFTVEEIQNYCQQQYKDEISPNLVLELLQKLISLGILCAEVEEQGSRGAEKEGGEEHRNISITQPKLKPCVHWVAHPDGYWILRNPEDVTFLQVCDRDKAIIEQLGQIPAHLLAEEFCITQNELRYLLQLLTATAMLEGTKPAKRRRGKLSPLQLLSFKIRLFNPDPFLTKHIDKIRYLWTQPTAIFLTIFLIISAVVGFNQRAEIIFIGQKLLATNGSNLILPFALLTAFVVTLHELGHAFTLKNYNGIVPEIGLLFMCLVPAVYTNTTDSYCLSRFRRILVVGVGVLVQLILAAFGLWLWNVSASGTWLSTASFLLMSAALFTVALNLNPLAKFDGYYLAVAITGINNLRSRSFAFYGNLLTGKPIQESSQNRWILATYAPFSIGYIWMVFGFLFWRITEWSLINIPMTALILLFGWGIYFLFPSSGKK